jgi:tRNA-dihydrouridine synthase
MSFSWQKLAKPFFVLAPMDDVTDTVFRQIVLKHGKPDVFVTEFTNTDALCSEGEDSTMRRLLFDPVEKPIIAQIWGTTPLHFAQSAEKIREMGFSGIDINMGCPVRDVVQGGACSALIKNPSLAKEIIQATKKGASGLPVSVKTRLGFNEIETEEWIGFLLSLDLDAITIHARTAKEMSAVPAHWEEITKAVTIRDRMGVQTVIIGNGDVQTKKDGKEKAAETGADGIMIGRGVFHNLFAFRPDSECWHEMSVIDKILILKEHVTLYEKTWGERRRFPILKKFFKIYINGFPNASEMRIRFMETESADEALKLADSLLAHEEI